MPPSDRILWNGDAMEYAKAHVDAGILSIDEHGFIWRHFIWRHGRYHRVVSRRAENYGNDYLRIVLTLPEYGPKVLVMAHQLVYAVRVGPIPPELEINHKNLNKTDNRVDNLELMTGSQNVSHAYAAGRTRPWANATHWRGRPRISQETIARANEMRASGATVRAIAEQLGISRARAHVVTGGKRG